MRLTLSLALSSALLLAAPSVVAQSPASEGPTQFDRGAEAYLRGDYETAIDAFTAAYRSTGRSGLLFSIAQAQRLKFEATRDAGSLRLSLRHYADYLDKEPNGPRAAEAQQQLKSLSALPEAHGWDQPLPDVPALAERAVATLVVVGHDGSVVLLDGARLGTLPVAELRTSPGEHTVELRKDGYFGVKQRVQVRAGERRQLRLWAPATSQRQASIGAVIGGATVMAVGGVLASLALSHQSHALDLHGDQSRAAEYNDALRARNSLRLAAAISGGIGAAALSLGAYSLFTEGFGPTLDISPAGDRATLVGVRSRF